MQLDIISISMTVSAGTGDEGSGSRSVHCSVWPHDRDHMDLATGEIFENPRFSRIRNRTPENQIEGSLSVYEAAENEETVGRMLYWAESSSIDHYSPPTVHFRVQLPHREFLDLLDSLRHQMLPTTVTIDLAHDIFDENSPLKYGWEPDGSGTKWDNSADGARQIGIRYVRFDYDLLKAETDEESLDDTQSNPPTTADIGARVSKIDRQLASVGRDLKIIAAVAIAVAVYFLLKG